jgi:hypothetical protein
MTDAEPDPTSPLSFERDIRPMFREKDRASMLKAFDLWSHNDVVVHQDPIASQLAHGTMPCDGAWSSDRIALFERWVAEGSQP